MFSLLELVGFPQTSGVFELQPKFLLFGSYGSNEMDEWFLAGHTWSYMVSSSSDLNWMLYRFVQADLVSMNTEGL